MHPRYLRELVNRATYAPRVFVAMSFAPEFEARFQNVIVPAVSSVHYRGEPLTVHRVDQTRVSDSIVAEIVDGVARNRVVLVDISTVGSIAGRAIRNGNVMYELGLAHAMRRPEEVVILRSDDDPLLFDVSGIRVQRYDPDGKPDEARTQVAEAIADALRFSAIADQWSVDRTVDELDPLGIAVLLGVGGFALSPDLENMKQACRDARWVPTVHRLLSLGVIRTRLRVALSPTSDHTATLDDLSELEHTDLGVEVMFEVLERTGIWEAFAARVPEIAAQRDARLRQKGSMLADIRVAAG